MEEKHLHIVSFNVPYPANYGGVIDVFHKLKTLSENNVKITLHVFEYGRTKAAKLEQYCEKVYYYKRNTGWKQQLSLLPYIVYSRKNPLLLTRLLKDDYPILFEGLHTTYYLDHPLLKGRLKLVRAHNIEHVYYSGLARNTRSLIAKTFFRIEAARLKKYESILKHADYILPLSSVERDYFEAQYGEAKIQYIPLFAHNIFSTYQPENIRQYVLYQGDLSTPENTTAARFLIQSVAAKDPSVSWIFAGMNPPASLIDLVANHKNVAIRANLNQDEMDELIHNAAVNILYTNQVSGVKLKLLNALHKGNHCIATKEMVAGSGLESLCTIVSHNPDDILAAIKTCFENEINPQELKRRKQVLGNLYNNNVNAHKIIYLLK